ncbi:MAG: hypothetical protein KGJ37_01045 [Verrucomicrobiota bacterium]|nr:hypothetical protein [Verrucomicrobiota bacterium]
MQTSSAAYYQPSGKMPLAGVLMFLVGSIVAALPLSAIYVLAIRYIPFIYLNLLALAAFALGFGFITSKLAEFGKLRSPVLAGFLGFIAGLAAVWLQWAFFATFMLRIEEASFFQIYGRLLAHPASLWSVMGYISEHGTWSFKNDEQPVTGFFLISIWIAEALCIATPPAIFTYGQAGKPFSELLQRWAKKVRLPGHLPFFQNHKAVRSQLESGDLMPLVTNEKPAAMQYAQLDLYSAEDDPSCFFLSLENVNNYLDKKGRKQRQTTSIVSYLRLPADIAKQLQELHSTPLATK